MSNLATDRPVQEGLHELCLFAGAGGGVLGSILNGWRVICYVENDPYCIEVLKARIKDGIYDDAPIWDDIRTFDGRPWCGCVDIVTAGFPCTPFSVAGKRAGADDERNMWPETLRVISEVRPRYAFLENVPGLISSGYFGTILCDLAASGYDAEWCVLGADDVGAPHRRKRLWILAYSRGRGFSEPHLRDKQSGGAEIVSTSESARLLAHSQNAGTIGGERFAGDGSGQVEAGGDNRSRSGTNDGSQDVADTKHSGVYGRARESGKNKGAGPSNQAEGCSSRITWWDTDPADVPDTKSIRNGRGSNGREGWNEAGRVNPSNSETGKERSTQPRLGRVVTGCPDRTNRLKALGNMQVPGVVRAAWGLLSDRQARGGRRR